MNARVVGRGRFVAAASATAITALGAWAFVRSSASIERDPRFASITTARATVRIMQLQSGTVATCPNNPEIRDPLVLVCLRG